MAANVKQQSLGSKKVDHLLSYSGLELVFWISNEWRRGDKDLITPAQRPNSTCFIDAPAEFQPPLSPPSLCFIHDRLLVFPSPLFPVFLAVHLFFVPGVNLCAAGGRRRAGSGFIRGSETRRSLIRDGTLLSSEQKQHEHGGERRRPGKL